jgi:hypothetical protein
MGRRRWIGFMATLGAAVALAACGGNSGLASKSPDQILNASSDAMAGAKTVRLSLSGKVDGAELHAQIDLVSGKGLSATFASRAGAFDLIVTGGTVYMRGNTAMWKLLTQTTVVGQQIGAKWVKATATGASTSGVSQLVRMTFASLISLLRQYHGTLTKGSRSTVNGRRVIALHSSKGGTLYVAVTGKPYLVSSVGGRIGTVTLSDYGRSFSINPPSHALNLTRPQQLGGGRSVQL